VISLIIVLLGKNVMMMTMMMTMMILGDWNYNYWNYAMK